MVEDILLGLLYCKTNDGISGGLADEKASSAKQFF